MAGKERQLSGSMNPKYFTKISSVIRDDIPLLIRMSSAPLTRNERITTFDTFED